MLEQAIAILQNTRSESSLNLIHCRVCDRYGHRTTGCIQMGALVCQYCREVGHGERDCNVRRRDERRFHPEMQFCLVCSQPGHSVGIATHCNTHRSNPSTNTSRLPCYCDHKSGILGSNRGVMLCFHLLYLSILFLP